MNCYSKYIKKYQIYVVVVADSPEQAYEYLLTNPIRVFMFKLLPGNKVKWVSEKRQFPDSPYRPTELVIDLNEHQLHRV